MVIKQEQSQKRVSQLNLEITSQQQALRQAEANEAKRAREARLVLDRKKRENEGKWLEAKRAQAARDRELSALKSALRVLKLEASRIANEIKVKKTIEATARSQRGLVAGAASTGRA